MTNFMHALIYAHLITGLIGILLGLIIAGGMLANRPLRRLHTAFVLTTLAPSLTGFVFLPAYGFSSAQLVGVFSVLILSLAIYARYRKHLAGTWNPIFIVCVLAALFLNLLIAITQSFEHFSFLKRIAPTQLSPAFIGLKWGLLIVFAGAGFFAVRRSSQR